MEREMDRLRSNVGKITTSLGINSVDDKNYSDLNPEQKNEHTRKLIEEQNGKKKYTETVDGLGKKVVIEKKDFNKKGEVVQFNPKEG